MRTKENLVNPASDYYLYQPSTIASKLIFIRKKSDIFTMNQDTGAPEFNTTVFF